MGERKRITTYIASWACPEDGKTKMNRLLLFLIILIVSLVVLLSIRRLAIAVSPSTPLEVFKSRSEWKQLPPDLLIALATRLNSVKKASEFVELCERTGMLRNNIIGVVERAHGDTEFAIGGIAITLTSYANVMGAHKQYSEAKGVLELALLLRPRHVPAWGSMAMTSYALGECKAAVFWADKVLAFKPDPNSEDSYEWAFGELSTEEGQRRYATIFEDPEATGNWKREQELMKAIKDACSK